MATKREILKELVRQFPNAPALTLARKAFRENPERWSSVERCRWQIREILGAAGDKNRRKCKPDLYRQPRSAGHWRQFMPDALKHFDDWGPVQFAGPLRALVISDLHIPYHDLEAVHLAIDYGLKRKATHVLMNGDVVDHFSISRWEKDPRKRDFPAEIKAGKQFLKGIREAFPRATIIFKEGNHEERWEAYLRVKAPDLLGVEDFEWGSVYGLDKHKIKLIGDKRPVRLGSLNVIHGHEYRFAISNPVNAARGLFLRGQCHALCGHFHQSAQHSHKGLEQTVVSTWSAGCLCDMHPDYAPMNNWNHGFAFVTVDKGGGFHVENLRIIGGRVY